MQSVHILSPILYGDLLMRRSGTAAACVWTWLLLTASLAAAPPDLKAELDVPTTGKPDPSFASFDLVMTSFLKQQQLPGGSLAVARNGKLVYARGFGYADLEKKEAVEPAALFRIASVSKTLTAVAILQLVEHNKLKLNDRVFEVLGLKEPSDPRVSFDERWKRVTILHLLQHTGGWNRERTFDPMFRSALIVKELGGPAPIGPDAIIHYMLRRPLDFDPGNEYAYSNFGYCLLGRVIEKASGEGYETYVCKEVLVPLGITSMKLGKTLPEERVAGEVKYYSSAKAPAVLGSHPGELVPLPYGAFNLETLDAHGGWLGSAADLARFGSAFNHPAKCKILGEKSIKDMFARPEGAPGQAAPGRLSAAYYGCGWYVRPVGRYGQFNTWHTGTLPGTSALLVRRADGLTWAVLFNSRDGNHGARPSDEIDRLLHEAADAYLLATK